MHSSTLPIAQPDKTSAVAGSFYRAVWRWHFYAGLVVLPFLVWLASTGGLFVFKDQIDGYFHKALKTVPSPLASVRPHSEIVSAAMAFSPGKLFKYTPAVNPHTAAEVGVATSSGERLVVYVDSTRAQVLGSLTDRGTVAWTIRKLHSLKYFNSYARGAIEIAAGWAILLVFTGVYLWWPRGRKAGVVSVRGKPGQRIFWRDLHAVTGIFAGGALVFLAITGMPWSVVWGDKVNEWANGKNFGYPNGVYVGVPMSEVKLSSQTGTSWSMEQARVPQSTGGHEGHDGHEGHEGKPAAANPEAMQALAVERKPLGLDEAVGLFSRLGLSPGFTVNPPAGPSGVYSATVYPYDLARQRVTHIDQYTGKTLVDMSYADYGILARWLEWGINVHMGQEFGVPNQALLVAVCAGIILLCVSAATMWWKRRPAGKLGVPAIPQDRRALAVVALMLAVGGLVFPLVGASLIVMLLLDWLLVVRPKRTQA